MTKSLDVLSIEEMKEYRKSNQNIIVASTYNMNFHPNDVIPSHIRVHAITCRTLNGIIDNNRSTKRNYFNITDHLDHLEKIYLKHKPCQFCKLQIQLNSHLKK